MSMYSDDWNYATSRLQETIVRRGKEPVFVIRVDPGMFVRYTLLEDDEEVKVCDIDDLDLKPVPLGYCNYGKFASYLTRIPMRRDWRQGLRRGNFTSLSGHDADRIPYGALRKVIIGEYPTFKECLKLVAKLKTIAWHRHWCVDNEGLVFHKGSAHPVGKVVDEKIELTTRYSYLKEALQEVM